MHKSNICVVIPTFNSYFTLSKTLRSLEKQTASITKTIVVDNASSDSTSQKVIKNFPKVELLTLKTNLGVVGGRNAGIKKLPKNFDYVLFLDHDMIADKQMVENMVKVFGAKPESGIVTPKIYYLSNKKRIWSAGTGINLFTGQILFRGGDDKGQFDQIEEVQVAPAAILVKKNVLNKIQKFDERYFATYEDTDLCFRAKKFGFKTFYTPTAIAYHDLPEDPEQESKRLLKRLYWVGRNRILFMRDFGSNFSIFLLFLPVFFVYYLNLSFKYGTFANFLSFVRGNIDGLRGK